MELSSDVFRQLIESIEPLDRQHRPEADERRHSPRVAVAGTVFIIPLVGDVLGDATNVRVEDVSARGIRFHYHRPLEIGSRLVLHLQGRRSPSRSIRCTVRFCAAEAQSFRVGAEFDAVGASPVR